MLKWIIMIFVFYGLLGAGFWYFSSARPLSEQIDVKTMSLVEPDYIFKKYSVCDGDCRNRSYSSSSRSSWGGGGGGGK